MSESVLDDRDLRIKQLEAEVKCWMDNAKAYDKARIKEMEKRDLAVTRAEVLQKEVSKLRKMLNLESPG
jgi:hypothetical protein